MYGFEDMFGFEDMEDNYGDRKVENTNVGLAEIDTCAVTDSQQPFETGIKHPRYNDGEWVAVEMYDNKEEAVAGHSKWCNYFKNGKLPPSLRDVSSAGAKLLVEKVGAFEECEVFELSAE